MGTFQQTLILISTLILIKNSEVVQVNAEGDCILRNEISIKFVFIFQQYNFCNGGIPSCSVGILPFDGPLH